MTKYILRAEVPHDLFRLLEKLPCWKFDDYDNRQHSNQLAFSSDKSIDELRDVIKEIPDGHVMLQTIQPEAEYTGNRDWSLS